LYKNEAYIL